MAQTSLTTHRLDRLRSRQSLPLMAGFAVMVAERLAKWDCRYRSRIALSHLSPDQLKDIGLTPDMVAQEIQKPFWQI